MYFTSQELYYNHNRTTNITYIIILAILDNFLIPHLRHKAGCTFKDDMTQSSYWYSLEEKSFGIVKKKGILCSRI